MMRFLFLVILIFGSMTGAQTIPRSAPSASATAPRGQPCQDPDAPVQSVKDCLSGVVENCGLANATSLRVTCRGGGENAPLKGYTFTAKIDKSELEAAKIDLPTFCTVVRRLYYDQGMRSKALCPKNGHQPEGGMSQWLDDNVRAACSYIRSRPNMSEEYQELGNKLNCNQGRSSSNSRPKNSAK